MVKSVIIPVTLISFTLLSLLLRVLPFYNDIFTSHGVNFSTVDAYYHMYIVDNLSHNFPNLSPYLTYLSYPGVQNGPSVYFFDWLLAAVVWLTSGGNPTPSLINVIGAYYPAILGALIVIPVYFIGKTLHSRMAGIIAAALIAVMPGEFLGRSILGSTDQHVLEVLLSSTGMLFMFMLIKYRQWKYGAFAVAVFSLYLGTWSGALLFGFIFLLFYVFTLIRRHEWKSVLMVCAVVPFLGWLLPEIVRSGFSVFYPSGVGLTTAEMQPLLAPGGNFTLAAAWANFGFCLFLSLVAMLLLLILVCNSNDASQDKQGEASLSLFVVWCVVILAAMLGQRRFAYYFAVNVAILTGFLLAWLAQRKKNLVLVLLAATFLSFGNASYKAFSTPPDWQEAMLWLRENTPEPYGDDGYYYQFVDTPSVPDYTVLSWWDYGYWITRIGHRVPVVNPSQDALLQKRVASILLSQNNTEAIEELRKLKTRYIVIDSQMVNEKFWAVALWAGEKITENSPEYHKSLMVRLNKGLAVEGFQLAYDANSVKIFKVAY